MKRLSFLAMALAAAGCGASHTAAWEVKSGAQAAASKPSNSGDAVTLVAQGDEHWQKREDRAELEAAMAAWDQAVAANPDDGETHAKLARAAYLLADGHLSFEGEAQKPAYLAMHERGMAYGEKALMGMSAEFKQRVQAGTILEDAVEVLDARAVPALYWYTSNLGKWANAQGFTTVLKHKNRIKSFIEKCLALEEGFFYSAPHRYLGVIYAKAPAIAGGDMKKSKEHFEQSLQAFPDYLATRVLWAEFYAVKAEDKEGFKRELDYVLKAADDVIPELTPEHKIEKKKAQRLLSQIEEKF